MRGAASPDSPKLIALRWWLSLQQYLDQGLRWLVNTNEHGSAQRQFYFFRPYPGGLKHNQRASWADLQAAQLQPFRSGDHYQYLSSVGLHLWVCDTDLAGLPETALQAALPDGTHWVEGQYSDYVYQQQWRNGVMVSCRVLTHDDAQQQATERVSMASVEGPAWANPPLVHRYLRSPIFWGLNLACFTLIVGVFFVAQWLTHVYAANRVETKIAEIQSALGDQLALRSQHQTDVQHVRALHDWRFDDGHLPTLITEIVLALEPYRWTLLQIQWQGQKVAVEILSSDIEITEVVSKLEADSTLRELRVRPDTRTDVWTIELGE